MDQKDSGAISYFAEEVNISSYDYSGLCTGICI